MEIGGSKTTQYQKVHSKDDSDSEQYYHRPGKPYLTTTNLQYLFIIFLLCIISIYFKMQTDAILAENAELKALVRDFQSEINDKIQVSGNPKPESWKNSQGHLHHSPLYKRLVTLIFGDERNLPFRNFIEHASGELIKPADFWYPHTHLQTAFADAIIDLKGPDWVLEMGSFEGGSALVWAEILKERSPGSVLVCMDPWSGDVNMWEWKQKWLSLLSWGMPGLYSQFMSNIIEKGHDDVVIPMQVTSVVGMKFFIRMIQNGEWKIRPEVVYLDSAHEYEETLTELRIVFDLLPPGGIVAGDDYNKDNGSSPWPGLVKAIREFATRDDVERPDPKLEISGSRIENEKILLYHGQWALQKAGGA